MAVLAKMTVARKERDVKESVVRYNMIRDKKMIVDGWQQRQEWTSYCRCRITEKNVWIALWVN
jgi:hypothetical protein